ncbi:MAG: spondin domain-containing protein [Actinomycetota bacterium]
MRRISLLALAVTVLGAFLATGGSAQGQGATSDSGADSQERHWRVTISNLTPPGSGPPGSQPLSPPLFVVHSNRADVWSVGEIASHVVAAIAEDANNAPAESALVQLPGVTEVFTGEGGPIPSGESRTYLVTTQGRFNRLTILTMLVNTNDAFTGLDGLQLRGHERTRETNAYDAGSEVNNEQMEFIPGPCCGNPFVRDPEGELIRHHPGIEGVGDLDPDVYGWTDPVAMIVIERVANG